MASTVEVCNQALFMLGQNSIISLTDDNEAARLCNGRYAYNRDATLRAYNWNFAMTRAELAQSSDTPSWGYDYKYALPTDPLCLRVLEVKEQNEYPSFKWKVEGRFILIDATTCNILYIAQVTDANEMDVLFREAWAARIAADICYALTGNSTQQEAMWKLYHEKLREARSVDAQEGTPESLVDDTFIEARR